MGEVKLLMAPTVKELNHEWSFYFLQGEWSYFFFFYDDIGINLWDIMTNIVGTLRHNINIFLSISFILYLNWLEFDLYNIRLKYINYNHLCELLNEVTCSTCSQLIDCIMPRPFVFSGRHTNWHFFLVADIWTFLCY